MRVLWQQGSWPQALGLGIALLNLESGHLPGADALYVRTATDLLLKEATEAAERSSERVRASLAPYLEVPDEG